jgi:type I restriction enzyme R subunit
MNPSSTPEYVKVELPFIEQLQALGWDYLPGDVAVPYLTERETFRQVLLRDRLRDALRRINLDEADQPWLDEARVTQAVSALERLGYPSLLENNQEATRLLIKGTQVTGPDGGKAVPVHYIDYAHPERNDFLAINQFRVDPPWATGNRGYVVPDLVLFVNGIPLVVVEAKDPDTLDPLTEAIGQLLRYSNQRLDVLEVEGVERLFHYAQLLVATCFEEARLGTVGALHKYYLAWRDTYPVPQAQVAEEVGGADLSEQQTLVAGALRPAHLLDLLHNFTLFDRSGGRIKKIVPRYQQFRAVHKAVERLQQGATRAEDGEHDRRGGIIWHTQGSGKSLSMVFLIRKMRALPGLRRFKVVLVTDRTKLEEQLAETAALTGEPLQIADSIADFLELLRQPGAGLVFGMIQKVQDSDPEARPEDLPVLNPSEEILLLVDEAHRSHTNTLHARLMQALPNAAQIGFTGTPILEADKQPTHEIFGAFIDTYTLEQSQADGATVPIRYEGRNVRGEVLDAETLDEIFLQELGEEYDAEALREIRTQYVTLRKVLEAEGLIAGKARDLLRHYVTTVLPNGFKAQVVAVSRLAAVRYQAALEEARDALVEELEWLAARENAPATPLHAALPYLDLIRRLKFAAVISGDHNDPPSWKRWTRKGQQDAHVEDFKRAFGDDRDNEGRGETAMLVVCSMLLTGFDAPIEQALYVDRPLEGYELLQAIARVNRTYTGKEAGLVVDYFGLADHLHQALEIYTRNDIHGSLRPITDEVPKLRDRHARVVSLFTDHGCDLLDTEACVELLRDARLRARFIVTLREFLEILDFVLPRPEALPYVRDAQQLGLIRLRATRRYRDQYLDIAGAEAKVRRLIDEYVVAQGVDPRIPPLDILDAEFEAHVGRLRSPRAQAAEMEFAARHHIRQHLQEDPVYYQKLSERLEEILQRFADNWAAQVEALRDLIRDYRQTQAETSREEQVVRPFLRLLVVAQDGREPTAERRRALAQAAVGLVEEIRQEIARVDFWRKTVAQERLRATILRYLDNHDLVPFEQQEALADQLLQTARANHPILVASSGSH